MPNSDWLGLNATEALELTNVDRQGLFALIKAANITKIRCEIPWKVVASTTGARNYAYSDALFADAKAAGLEIAPLVAHPPQSGGWLWMPAGPIPTAPEFGSLMGDLAKRYPQVGFWEIWNEQNLQAQFDAGSPENFLPYLKAAAVGIRANSAAKVVLGGLAACASASRQWWQFWVPAFTNVDPVEYLTRLIAAGGAPYFDVLALHPYCVDVGFTEIPEAPTDPYLAAIDAAKAVLAKNNLAYPIWANEYGFPLSKYSPADASTNLAAETLWLKTKVDRAYPYCTRDNNGFNYGLLDPTNLVRPAYNWVKSYAASNT